MQRSSLFPYTTLFRSGEALEEVEGLEDVAHALRAEPVPGALAQEVHDHAVHLHGTLVRSHDPRDDVEQRRSEEHTSELQSQSNLVCRLLLEKKQATKT